VRRPTGLRGVVGTPAVTVTVVALASLGPYLWYVDPEAWLFGLGGLGVIGWTLEANTAVAHYTAWKREWDGMLPGGPPRRATDSRAFRGAMLALVVLAFAVFMGTQS
jgi:hypothetical protein